MLDTTLSSRPYCITQAQLQRTFEQLRLCGAGRRECQVLWVSAWATPDAIAEVVHPRHRAHRGGFEIDSAWLSSFWQMLTERGWGVRVQIHTHPREAFHSPTDDAFPVIHSPGFLSLVIPNFAHGVVGFDDAYLAELNPDGSWTEVSVHDHFRIL